jgi:hypothetical protein
VACLELKTAQELNLKLNDVAEMTGISTAALLEYHRTGIGAIKEAPLLSTRHPLTDFLTVHIVRILLIEGRLSEVDDLAAFLADLVLQLLADGGFADPIGTGYDDKLSGHGFLSLWLV